MHVSSRNMFPTTRNLQIRVHVYRPRHYCGDWLTFGCFVPMIDTRGNQSTICMDEIVSPESQYRCIHVIVRCIFIIHIVLILFFFYLWVPLFSIPCFFCLYCSYLAVGWINSWNSNRTEFWMLFVIFKSQNITCMAYHIFLWNLFQDTQNSLNCICLSDSNFCLHGFCFLVI
jgi:hypothetical protein